MSDIYRVLSPNFHQREFACKGEHCCGGIAIVNPNLVQSLQLLREMLGSPLMISSGVRCFVHNRSIGSLDTSQHPQGRAADVWSHQYDPGEIYDAALKIDSFRNGGMGLYATFVHLDVRGYRQRW